MGRITRPLDVKGAVRVLPETDSLERFLGLKRAFLGRDDDDLREVEVAWAKPRARDVVVKFVGIDSSEEAEKLRDLRIWVPREEALPLEEDSYYIPDLLGMEVVTEEGEFLGTLEDVWSLPANDVYIVRKEGKELLLPATGEVVREVDIGARRMVVRLLEGLEWS
ncbi:MAG TPA: 16S rRNA processing protein RimM [Candidatus Latescibacteria bacterium]|nr:16S rRNA processing protein RimM [Candidatus Latescibacterota bacterium]